MADKPKQIFPTEKDSRAKVNIDFDFQDNELNSYGNYTVNFKLFMLNERILNDKINETSNSTSSNDFLDVIASVPQITLAQSGRTSLYIEDVRIRNVVSHKPNKPSGVAQNIEFKVIEPFGTKFMDLIRISADNLGIENYSIIPWYLEVSFVGYKDGETLTTNISSKLKKLYRITITKIDMKVESQGSVYTLSAIESGHRFLNDISGRTEESMNLMIGAGEGEFIRIMKQFQDNAQKTALRLAVTDSHPLELPYFVFHEIKGSYASDTDDIKWEKLNFTTDPNFENKAGDYSKTSDDITGDIKQFTVPNRKRYPAIIQAMIAATNWGQDLILNQIFPKLDDVQDAKTNRDGRDPVSNEDKEKKHKLPPFLKFIKIVPEVFYLDYNLKVKDYNKIIIYNIYPYDGVSAWVKVMDDRIASMKDPRGTLRDLAQKKIQATAVRSVQKKYTYIFGRDNVDVEQMNLEYNTLFYSFIAPNSNFKSATNIGAASPLIESVDGKFAINSKQTDAFNAEDMEAALEALQSKIDELDNEINNVPVDDADAGTRRDATNDKTRELSRLQREQAALLFSLGPAVTAERARKRSLEEFKKGSTIFAEDIENKPQEGLNAVISTPVRAARYLSDSDLFTGLNLSKPQSTSVFNALANNIVQGGDLLQMELQIRGDPWWLGTSPAETFIVKGRTLFSNNIINLEKIKNLQKRTQALSFQGSIAKNNPDTLVKIRSQVDEIFNSLIQIPTDQILTDSDADNVNLQTNNIVRSSELPNADLNTGIERNKNELLTLYGQPMMLFQMYSPDVLATTEETGVASLTQNAMISGLWVVNEVETVFGTDGKFMQTLISVRDTTTSSLDIVENQKKDKSIDAVGDPALVSEGKVNKTAESIAVKRPREGPSQKGLLASAKRIDPSPADEAAQKKLIDSIPKAPARTSEDARKLAELSKLSFEEIRRRAQLRTLPLSRSQLPEE